MDPYDFSLLEVRDKLSSTLTQSRTGEKLSSQKLF